MVIKNIRSISSCNKHNMAKSDRILTLIVTFVHFLFQFVSKRNVFKMGLHKRLSLFTLLIPIIIIFELFSEKSICSSSSPPNVSSGYPEYSDIDDIDVACNLFVIPLKYEINIDPIQPTLNVTPTTAADKILVTAWVKITLARSNESDCYNNKSTSSGRIRELNARECKIDFDNVHLTKMDENGTFNFLEISNQTLVEHEPKDGEWYREHVIQFEDSNMNGTENLELHVPYKFELIRNYYDSFWNGLYYYDTREMNTSDSDQLGPLHAEFMFPAFKYFEKPTNKPTFKITVARSHSQNFVSISNMDILETTKVPEMEGWVRDHFRESPPMHPDQVTVMILRGFVNATFYHSEKNNEDVYEFGSFVVNLWTFENTPGNLSINRTGQETIKLLEYFNEQFNKTRYPLKKLDLIVVPWSTYGLNIPANLGFAAGSPEEMMLSNSKDNDAKSIRKNLQTLAFLRVLIAFQWFRGMVTSAVVRRYEDDWIAGQGLPRYVADWAMRDRTVEDLDSYTLYTGRNSLTMIENIFSRKIMQSAIADFYLPKTMWKAANPDDLYDALQQAIIFHNATHLMPPAENVTIKEILTIWIKYSFSYPVIKLSNVESNSSSSAGSPISVHQDKSVTGAYVTSRGWVHLKILTENGENLIWISPNNTSPNSSVIWSGDDNMNVTSKWLVAYPHATEYSDNLLKNIITQLNSNHTVFSPTVRRYLLENQFKLSITNEYGYYYVNEKNLITAMEMTKYVGNEMDLNVWYTLLRRVKRLDSVHFIEKPTNFHKYFANKMNLVLGEIGTVHVKEEAQSITLLRAGLFQLCGTFEIPLCVDFATKLMTKWMNNTKDNPFNQRHISESREYLYCAAIKGHLDEEQKKDYPTFHFLLHQLININNITEENVSDRDSAEPMQICRSLACVKNDNLLASLLTTDSKIAKLIGYCKNLEKCYKEVLPAAILANRPASMKQTVYDFWMNKTLEGQLSVDDLRRRFWDLQPRGYEPPGFVESIVRFLNEHEDLFAETGMESLKKLITKSKNNYNEFRNESGAGRKVMSWLEQNL